MGTASRYHDRATVQFSNSCKHMRNASDHVCKSVPHAIESDHTETKLPARLHRDHDEATAPRKETEKTMPLVVIQERLLVDQSFPLTTVTNDDIHVTYKQTQS